MVDEKEEVIFRKWQTFMMTFQRYSYYYSAAQF